MYLADVHPSPVATIPPLLKHPRNAVRKRAAVVLAQSLPTSSQAIFDHLIADTVDPPLRAGASVEEQRTVVLLLGAIARYAPSQAATVILATVPAVLSLADVEDEELRENCLQVKFYVDLTHRLQPDDQCIKTLEALVLRCPSDMTPFIPGTISIGTKLIKYDPVSAQQWYVLPHN